VAVASNPAMASIESTGHSCGSISNTRSDSSSKPSAGPAPSSATPPPTGGPGWSSPRTPSCGWLVNSPPTCAAPGNDPCPPRRLTPARVRRGFPYLRPNITLRPAPKPSRPGPGRPPGVPNQRRAPRHDVGKTHTRARGDGHRPIKSAAVCLGGPFRAETLLRKDREAHARTHRCGPEGGGGAAAADSTQVGEARWSESRARNARGLLRLCDSRRAAPGEHAMQR
jgi:hypothetical protein